MTRFADTLDKLLTFQKNPSLVPTKTSNGPILGGVHGLMTREAERSAQTQQALIDAFADTQALMLRARQLMDLARNLKEANFNKKSGKTDDDGIVGSLLAELGVPGVIDKSAERYVHIRHNILAVFLLLSHVFRTAYLAQLGHQLAQVTVKLLQIVKRTDCKNRDVEVDRQFVPLADVYCVYSRARGMDLCSPKDCCDAVRQAWPQDPQCPVRAWWIAKGILVVGWLHDNQHQKVLFQFYL